MSAARREMHLGVFVLGTGKSFRRVAALRGRGHQQQ
jgi:hypothetical protein